MDEADTAVRNPDPARERGADGNGCGSLSVSDKSATIKHIHTNQKILNSLTMSKIITLRKGLDINLVGKPQESLADAPQA